MFPHPTHHHTLSLQRDPHERFPHGPRKLKDDALNVTNGGSSHKSSFQRRRRRSFVVSDSKARNANVGVSGLYEVISEADLAFTPDNKQEAVTIFQGKIREEVVYGICLPVQGFSAIFALMALCAIVSAIVAGFLLYRYQVQRQKQRILQHQQRMHQQRHYTSHLLQTGFAVNSLANWMALRFIGGTRLPQPASDASSQRQTGSNHKS